MFTAQDFEASIPEIGVELSGAPFAEIANRGVAHLRGEIARLESFIAEQKKRHAELDEYYQRLWKEYYAVRQQLRDLLDQGDRCASSSS